MANKSLDAWIHAFPLELQRFDLDELAKEGTVSEASVKMLKKQGQEAVWFMPMSSEDRDTIELMFAKLDGKKAKEGDDSAARARMSNFTARYVAHCWRDEKGAPMGTARELGKLLPAILIRDFFKIIQKMNGMDEEAADEAGKD